MPDANKHLKNCIVCLQNRFFNSISMFSVVSLYQLQHLFSIEIAFVGDSGYWYDIFQS